MSLSKKMQATQRYQLILKEVNERGYVTISEMADLCSVSEMTMRRDLDKLDELKLIERNHGGATSLNSINNLEIDLIEPEVIARSKINSSQKEAIAKVASTLISPGQTIALDIGSTAFQLARLMNNIAVNIHTTSLKIASYINNHKGKVYIPCGQIFGSEPSVIGAQAIRHLENLSFDIAFIGVSGISSSGLHDYSIEDTEIKRTLMRCSKKCVVLSDSSKFNRVAFSKISGFEDIDILITDTTPPLELKNQLENSNVQVLLAQDVKE